MMRCIRTLTAAERSHYLRHLLRLDAEDRRRRFGHPIDDDGIRRHVSGIDVGHDRIFVQIDDSLEVIAAVHVAGRSGDTVEFAFSVEKAWRNHGLGRWLFDHAILWARNRGVRRAYTYCQADNHVMRRLAHRAGMRIETDAGETEGWVELMPATPLSLLREFGLERAGLIDLSLKAGRRALQPAALQPA